MLIYQTGHEIDMDEMLRVMQNPPPPRPEVCETHGGYESRLVYAFSTREIWSDCPECARIKRAEQDERERAEAERARQIQVENDSRAAGVPQRFRDALFCNYECEGQQQRRALEVAQKFCSSERAGRSLILTGLPGTGKTHLACAIVHDFLSRRHQALFTTAIGLVRSVRDTYRRDSEISERDALRRLTKTTLLVIDEVGVQHGTEHEKTILFDVINERYQDMRPTVLSSNLSEAELGKFLGDRIMDRFAESGAVVAMQWNSYRRKAR